MGFVDGRVVVVTGAGGGIGAALARSLADEGARVVVNDIGVTVAGTDPSTAAAQRVVDTIVATGGSAVADTHDVADFAGAKGLIDHAIDEFGKLDVLINAAGILRPRMIFNMTEDEWDSVIRVHLRGTFCTSRFAAAYWRELRDEKAHHRIINFTSGAGTYGAPGQPNYSAAKAGIVGLTLSCANALDRYGVTANAISPVATTRMTDTIPADRSDFLNPVGEAPEDVAPAVVYLASERSDWCTGRVFLAGGRQVTLYRNVAPASQIWSLGRWDLDELAIGMETTFKGDIRARGQ